MLRNGEKESALNNYRILSLYESYNHGESKIMTNDFQMLLKMERKLDHLKISL